MRFQSLRHVMLPAFVVALVILIAVIWPRGRGPLTNAGGLWTCSMHPQIRMDHFDRCPICGMDLIPVARSTAAEGHSEHANHLQLTEHAAQMARVGTVALDARPLLREIRTVGKIDFDETRMAQIASRLEGRVEQVFADFPGTLVKKGDHLVSIYSPELLATQEELLVAAKREQEQRNPAATGLLLSTSARRRLRLWGITEEQINEIIKNGRSQTLLTVYAPLGGTVIEKMIRAGQYVKEGDNLYTIADLTHVWLIVDVYETDLPWVRFGQTVQVSLEADPAVSFNGQVGFIEPVVNEKTRTVRVRVILKNDEGKLKPGMFAHAIVRVAIMPDGNPAPTGLEGKFACPMHPYVVSDGPSECRVCRMPLEKVPGKPVQLNEPPQVLAVPADAVLTTGRRQLVYLDRGKGLYELAEPHLGPRAGDYYPVLDGMKAGDRVVSRGNFLLDSQFQISGKPSLLYPEGMAGSGHGQAAGAAPEKPDSPAVRETIQRNLAKLSPGDKQLALAQMTCPVTGLQLGAMGAPIKVDIDGRTVFLCCSGCTPAVKKDPASVLKKLDAPVSNDVHAGHEK